MYRIFLVDDDEIERRGMTSLPLFGQLEAEIVGQAWNGEEALKAIGSLRPDIVISDVRMPVMDGLILAEELNREYPEIILILMSGYEDFQAVRQAIQFGAEAFLTKPLNIEELKSALIRSMDRLDAERHIVKRRERVSRQIDQLLPVLRERVIRDLLLGVPLLNDNAMREEITETGLFRDADLFCVFDVQIENWVSVREEASDIINAFQEMEGELEILPVVIQSGRYALVVVLPPNLDDEALFDLQQRRATAVLNMLQQFCCRAAVGVSEVSQNPQDLNRLYRHASLARQNQDVYGSNRIYWYDGKEVSGTRALPDTMKTALALEQYLIQTDRNGVEQTLEAFFDNLQSAGADRETAQYKVLELLLHIVVVARQDGKDFLSIFEDRTLPQSIFDRPDSIQDLCRATVDLFCNAQTRLYAKPSSQGERLVSRVQEIINARYAQNTSTDMIAKELYVAPSHLRRVYKNLTGKTIQEAILAVRMQRARELLLDPSVKVYEIAQAVGFESQSYFGIVFKKYYGVTAGEYRNAVL